MPRNSECTGCKLHEGVKSVCVWGEWYDDNESGPVVMCIAEAPGEEEDKQCRPLVGKSGKLFREILDEVGVGRVYLANCVKCRPPNNRTPHLNEIRSCHEYLLEEIEQVNPDFIILLGATAIKVFTEERSASVGLNRNRKNWTYGKAQVIATYHPAAACYGDSKVIPAIVDDLLRIRSREFVLPEEPAVKFVDTVLPKYIAKTIAFDIETTGLNPFNTPGRDDVLCVAWSGSDNKAYVTADIDGFLDCIESKQPVLIGHNVKFDLMWLGAAYDYWYSGKVYDTLVMAHLTDENRPSKGLKYLAGLYTGYGDYAKEVEKNLKLGTINLLDKQILQRYCAYDAAATYRIYTVLLEQIKREGLTTLLEEQMQLLGTVIDMEHHGFKIDMKELTHLRGKVSSRIRRLSSDVLKQHPELKNLDSPKQISSYLYEALHLPVKSKTQKGSPSVDEGALEGLLETTNGRKHEDLLRGLLERRKLKKILSTYIDGTREACDGQDLVHPSFNLCGTVTGRFSCSSPNLQNIPRDDTASGVKRIFTARPGNVLVQADYSQIELRIGAFLSRDKTMLRALRAGDDLHRRTGEALYSDITGKETVITDEQRTVAKTVNFGIFYGMGPRRLHQTTGIPLRQASQFIKRWYTLYPGVRDWLTGVEEELLSKGYVTSIFGRRRRLPIHVTNNVDEYKHMLRQACNFPVQSAASELTQMAMILLGKEYQIVGNVHDSILIECPEGVKEEVIPRVKQVMEHVTEIVQQFGFDVQFDLPMPVDIKSGSDWGDVS